jgi:outer membrane protein insertion porin family
VQLDEQSTGELSFGAGYSTSEGIIGDISLTERNLMGRGQFLRLRLAGSLDRMQVDLSFTEPRFLDRNLAAGFDLFHKVAVNSSTQPFDSRSTGGSVRIGFPLAENLWLVNSYSLVNNAIENVQAGASQALIEAAGTYWTSAWGTNLSYDTRNHPKDPTSGYFLSAGSELAGLGGDVHYWRVIGEGRDYYPITEKITFVSRAVGGYIQGWGGQDVRLIDLFFKGGETVRGFDRAGYGPRDLNTGDALGGATYWATTAEIRFPIPFVPDDLGISGAVFADAGSLFNAGQGAKDLAASCIPGDPTTVCLADDATIRSSVGASLMWASPVGPIRMDFAKVLTKESYDDEQFFRFGAATKF